mmetsp:Transcript_36145/g.83962  ORF Transcript_36145/g.83962 Transcript_36145/m.83962 type:complete len:82 (+) Transcript_36145:64-309(+)
MRQGSRQHAKIDLAIGWFLGDGTHAAHRQPLGGFLDHQPQSVRQVGLGVCSSGGDVLDSAARMAGAGAPRVERIDRGKKFP